MGTSNFFAITALDSVPFSTSAIAWNFGRTLSFLFTPLPDNPTTYPPGLVTGSVRLLVLMILNFVLIFILKSRSLIVYNFVILLSL